MTTFFHGVECNELVFMGDGCAHPWDRHNDIDIDIDEAYNTLDIRHRDG